MHAKTDSEVTSLAPSSPARSPSRRQAPVYFVQSPSHDGGDHKTATSFHSTPATSPPRHSHSSVGPHSRDSSTRFSAATTKKPAIEVKARKEKEWKEIDVIEEEGLLDDEEADRRKFTKRMYCLAFILGFFALFSFFALILWGASRSQKPQLTMQSIKFENFIIQAGTDASMVPTDMATLNSTVTFTYRNTGTFFGIHVAATPFALTFNQLTLASGDMNNFYQRRKSQRNVNVVVMGTMVPLYGGGPSLTGSAAKPNSVPPIPLTLSFTVRSRAYVLGKLVKPKFTVGVNCSVMMDLNKLNKPVSLSKSCQYY